MSMNDPIADMLTRIRNAQVVRKRAVSMQASGVKEGIARVLKDEGYILGYEVKGEGAKRELEVRLKYLEGEGVIERIERVSRPGLRQYRGKNDLPRVIGGLGVAIVSTSHGIMADATARASGHGGEILAYVA